MPAYPLRAAFAGVLLFALGVAIALMGLGGYVAWYASRWGIVARPSS